MNGIIAAVRTTEEFDKALLSECKTVFLLNCEILELKELISRAHGAGKEIFIHFDFIDGLGKDKSGMKYLAHLKPDGIISVRPQAVRLAKECKMKTVQRFFIVDSRSVKSAMELIESTKPDMVEIMPAVVYRQIQDFAEKVTVPVIAGGLIKSEDEAKKAIKYGASAVSSGMAELWNISF